METRKKWCCFLLLPLLILLLFGRGSELRFGNAVSAFRPVEGLEEISVYVDGSKLVQSGLTDLSTGKHFAPAALFLDALDEAFWAGEKAAMHYRPLSLSGEEMLCVEDFCDSYGISVYVDEDACKLWCTSAAGDWVVPEGYPVPVLMYHGVSDDPWGASELFVSPGELERQLCLLLDRGYTPIWFEDLKHVDQIQKPILLTFDDGYRDNYTDLFPLLQQYHVKATLFLVSGYLDNAGNVSPGQVREMQDSGLVSIQCHTQYHPDLDTLDYEQQVEELCWSKLALLRLTDREPYVIAYPRGRQNEDTLTICRGDYRFGVKMGGPLYRTGADPLLIYRIGIYRSTSLEEFAAQFP